MLNAPGDFVLGVVLGLYLGLAFPHEMHSGLTRVGLGSILPGGVETKT